jgi:hypothetical protein
MLQPRALVRYAFCIVVLFIVAFGLLRCARSLRVGNGRVDQIVFLGDRILVRNLRNELFASEDRGRTWRELADGPHLLSMATGDEIWAAHGWPGHHEGPSATIWRSRDRGATWSSVDLDVPRVWSELDARLPAVFVNEPGDAPLLLMSNLQLARPSLVADSLTWERVGHPVPSLEHPRGTVDRDVAATRHRGSIYVAVRRAIYLSNDNGATWTKQDIPNGWRWQLRCLAATCYAFSDAVDSKTALLTTTIGTNDWKVSATLDESAVTPLPSDPWPTSFRFIPHTLLPTETGVYVAGFVHQRDGQKMWGVVIHVDHAGTFTRVGHSFSEGLTILERAPDGTLWAGGEGAYRLDDGEWVHVWP